MNKTVIEKLAMGIHIQIHALNMSQPIVCVCLKNILNIDNTALV